MVTTAPTAVRAAFATTINGVAYTKDQTLTYAQLSAIKHVDALLSKGVLYLVPDQHNRKPMLHYRRPSHLGPRELFLLGGSVGVAPHLAEGGGDGPMLMSVGDGEGGDAPDPVVATLESQDGNRVSLSVSGGTTPYFFDWGDDSTAHVQRAHTYQYAGEYTITVTDADEQVATVDVVIE
jgi:hypothetical protein